MKKVLRVVGYIIGGLIALSIIVNIVLGGREGGVRLNNNMESYALEYIVDNNILGDYEELVAYYDYTMSMDGTEAAILTNDRVIYHKNGHNDYIYVDDIVDIRHREEVGDIIEVYSSKGEILMIEIAPLNGGETFLNALLHVAGVENR
jgi:hypothetical protein